MSYTVRDSSGQPVSGDAEVDDNMRAYADSLGGSITNDQTGETVYPEED